MKILERNTLIKKIVEDYKRIFALEYNNFLQSIPEKKKNQENKFASVRGSDSEMRLITEIPETLYTMFVRQLTPEDLKEFKTIKNQRWFAKTYPEFTPAQKV